jgi:type IV pilus assembly protein PilB
VPPFMIAGATNMIVAQRLARKICKNCSAEDTTVKPEHLKDVGFQATEIPSVKCFKGKGCDICEGSGYKGRQGIYEFLEISNKVGQGIIAELKEHELLEVAKTEGFVPMEDSARGLIKAGILSYEEFLRVISISH